MENIDAKPTLTEDLEHGRMLMASMNGDQLTAALYAMEDILEGAVYVTYDMPEEDEAIDADEEASAARGRLDLKQGRTCTVEELAAELGISLEAIDSTKAEVEVDHSRNGHK